MMNKKKINVIAICGKSASGKDSILKELGKSSHVHTIVSCTTRPKRENETDGIDYHFISKDEFTKRLMCGDLLEATVFNTWCYGTSIQELDENKINIGAFNPEGLEILLEEKQVNLYPFYINVSDKNRLIRALNREENPNVQEIVRRYNVDNNDFYDIEDFPNIQVLTNDTEENFSECVNTILGKIDSLYYDKT